MILVLMVLALVTALTTTLATVTIHNLQGARRADEAGRVIDAAEAGVSQALTFIRQNGVRGLGCAAGDADDSVDCTAAYGRSNRVGPPPGAVGGASYRVWVEEVVPFSPKQDHQGIYVIHSEGLVGDGADASTNVSAKVLVSSFGAPQGVYAHGLSHTGNGKATLAGQSIFTDACFIHRDQLDTSSPVLDPYYDIPAAVHSSSVITNGGQNSCDGSGSGNGNMAIHKDGPCSSSYPYDQDAMGNVIDTSLSTSANCVNAVSTYPSFYGAPDPDTGSDGVYGSKIASTQALKAAFGLKDSPLSDDQTERLRRAAEDAGTLYQTATPSPIVSAGVYFFDLTNADTKSRTVSLSDIPAPTDPCQPPIVVIEDGNAEITQSVTMTLIMLTSGDAYGNVDTSGDSTFTGSLFARNLNLDGKSTLTQSQCAVDNTPTPLLNITVSLISEDG